MKRQLLFPVPTVEQSADYRPLKSVDDKTVGYVCRECGRLLNKEHFPHCSKNPTANPFRALAESVLNCNDLLEAEQLIRNFIKGRERRKEDNAKV